MVLKNKYWFVLSKGGSWIIVLFLGKTDPSSRSRVDNNHFIQPSYKIKVLHSHSIDNDRQGFEYYQNRNGKTESLSIHETDKIHAYKSINNLLIKEFQNLLKI